MAGDMGPEPAEPGPALTGSKMATTFGHDLVLADSVVLVFDAGLVPARGTTRAQRRATHPFRQVATLNPGVDMVLTAGPGAPVAAITVEFLAGLGVRRIIAVGTAGYLATDAEHSTPVYNVIERAESDEGTSAHFSSDLSADSALTTALMAQTDGELHIALTTDVPFRHTPARLASHRARAQVVDMECAALFAAARYFDMHAAALLTTSDVFGADDTWQPLPADDVKSSLHHAVQIAAQVLTSSR